MPHTAYRYLRDLLSYWVDGFPWREREREVNRHSHRIAHGRPGLSVELLPVLDRLDDHAQVFVTHAGMGSAPARARRR